MKRAWIVLAVVAACKSKAADVGGGAEVERGMPEAFASWIPKGAGTAWQGAWVSRLMLVHPGATAMSLAGDPVALEIVGATVKMFDGSKESALTYTLHTPCGTIVQPAPEVAGGATYQHHKQFVIVGGAVQAADGAAGYRKGKAAIACVIGARGGTYVLDDKGDCQQYEKMFDWKSSKAECAWTTENGKDVLVIGSGDRVSKLIADGDVLEDQQFRDSLKDGLHEKVADFAAAKAKVTALQQAHPTSPEGKAKKRAEEAKAAGGKVGETSTVASLIATYATDKSTKGKAVEVGGYFMTAQTSTMTSGSNVTTTYSASIANAKGDVDGLTLRCVAKAEITGFVQGDKVTMKGTVGEAFDDPKLQDCIVTK